MDRWDEFTWAREIRKDELRISGYFRALPERLDLPDEDDLIFKELMSQSELVPSGPGDAATLMQEAMDPEEALLWEEERREARRNCKFEVTRRVENLAREWNLYAAHNLSAEFIAPVLTVTCAFGKLLSRIYNFEENDTSESDTAEDSLALRTSLLKWMLNDLNGLHNELCKFKELYLLMPERIDDLCGQLAFIRESILDKLKELRK